MLINLLNLAIRSLYIAFLKSIHDLYSLLNTFLSTKSSVTLPIFLPYDVITSPFAFASSAYWLEIYGTIPSLKPFAANNSNAIRRPIKSPGVPLSLLRAEYIGENSLIV